MCLVKIAMDYVPATQVWKKRFFMLAAACFMLIGAFLFGFVTAKSIMDDVNAAPSKPIQNASLCT